MDREQEVINYAYKRDKRIDQQLKEEHREGKHYSYVKGCSICFYNPPEEEKGGIMNIDDAVRLVKLCLTADGNCSHCYGQLIEGAVHMWPEVNWKEVREQAPEEAHSGLDEAIEFVWAKKNIVRDASPDSSHKIVSWAAVRYVQSKEE